MLINYDDEYQKYYKEQLDAIFNLNSYRASRVPNNPFKSEYVDNIVYDFMGKEIKVESIGKFVNGYAIVKAYLETEGNGPKRTYKISDQPSYGCTTVYNYIDKNFRLITSSRKDYYPNSLQPEEKWFIEARDFHYGYAVAKKRGGYFHIKPNGEQLHQDDSSLVTNFLGKFSLLVDHSSFQVRNNEGDIVKLDGSNYFQIPWIRDHSMENTPFSRTINLEFGNDNRNMYSRAVITMNKNFLMFDKFNSSKKNAVVRDISHRIFLLDIDLKNYHVVKKMFNYEVSNGYDSFNLKHNPIKIFDNGHILCIKEDKLYLYDRATNSYSMVGYTKNTTYDDNLLINYDGNKLVKATLFYNGKVIDITDYYRENLMDVEDYKINPSVPILTASEFYEKNEEELRRKRKAEAEAAQEAERKRIEEADINTLQKMRDSSTDLERIIALYEKETGDLVEEAVKRIKNIQRLKGTPITIKTKSSLIEVGEGNDRHKEINPIFIAKGLYPSLDLSEEDMTNVKVSHLDLSGHNVRPFNPQHVYKKDMSFSDFSGIIFPVTAVFEGVDVRGSTFTTDGLDRTMDINEDNFIGAIYDEDTTLDGVPIMELLNEKEENNERTK
jgi:hypothetical protein